MRQRWYETIRWHEVGLMITCVLWCGLYFLRPLFTHQLLSLHAWSMHLFFGLGGLGGMVGLVGIGLWMRSHSELSLKLEQSGNLLAAAAGATVLRTILPMHNGYNDVTGIVLLVFLWIAPSIARAAQLHAQLFRDHRKKPR